jgi:glyoxylase-like metal-dependent hydrolase (beta-lactamase superfamily II)/rhodanese-related sulfurtransferase
VLEGFRAEIINALISSFPGVVFNSPVEHSLPTTINFSVPGLASKVLLDAFDSAGLRMSGGSACSASQTSPSHVLEAMGLESWRASSAVRLSFAPNVESKTISAACARIRACGTVLRANCLLPATSKIWIPPAELVTRYTVDGACSYLIADAASRRCVVVDPLPELTDQIANWLKCNFYTLVAAIDTHSHGDHVSSAAALRNAIPALQVDNFERDGLGWPVGQDEIFLGRHRLSRLPVPGHTSDSTAYLLHRGEALVFAFVGDTVMPGALGRSDFDQSEPIAFPSSLLALERVVGPDTLLLPAHDYENRFACTFRVESTVQPLLAAAVSGSIDAKEFAARKSELDRDIPQTRYCTMACGAPIPSACAQEEVELSLDEIKKLAGSGEPVIFVDVRERFEQKLGLALSLDVPAQRQSAPLSTLANVLPEWLQRPRAHIAFFCRSGNRSAQAARALRRLGHERAWSLDGGIALWAR